MSLSSSLFAALDGLRVSQSQLAIVSGNVANAQTPGYVRKTLDQVSTYAGESIGVRATTVNRQLDELVQAQLRTETSGGSYATLRARIYQQLQDIYGAPGSSIGIDTLFNNFTTAIESLAVSPDLYSAQSAALNAGQMLAQKLNTTAEAIQSLRAAAEHGIAADIDRANNALQQIAEINQSLMTQGNRGDAATATLLDQRDYYIDQLSQLMDIRVFEGDNNQIQIFTGSGDQLVGSSAARLEFNLHGTIIPASQWDPDQTISGVGTITLITPYGMKTDLIASGALRSGELAAYVEMRDSILPQAQRQLDEFAAKMSQAMSDLTTAGVAAVSGAQTGFDVDIGNLLTGNSINITYTDSTNVQRVVKVVRVDDLSVSPLPSPDPGNPNQQVVGVDFSAGLPSVVGALNAALGITGMQFSNPVGTTLRVLNNLANTVTVNAASTTTTMVAFASGYPQLAFFTDGGNPYSGATTAGGPQLTGYSARIAVNPALIASPFSLVAYNANTPAGDSTRPSFLYDQLRGASFIYSPESGIGGPTSPFSGTLSSFLSETLTLQGQAASNADNLKRGQDLVVNALQQRLNEDSGVNMDVELIHLLSLQNSYGANARVLTTVRQMFEILMNM